jgi:predicted TIM-barrel fold metal-dependent hydrolase
VISLNGVTVDGPIVDVHTHIGPATTPGEDDGRSADLLAAMDSAGVDCVCCFPSAGRGGDYRAETELICRVGEETHGRVIPFVRAHPYWREDAVADVEHAARLGVKGLKLHPFMDGAFLANDPVLVDPLLAVAAEHGLVVLFHSGWGFNSVPGLIADVAKRFPSVPVIVGHSGRYGFHRESAAVAADVPNLLLDVSGLSTPHAIEELVSLVGAERVLYGSDYPYTPLGFEVEKLVRWTRMSGSELAQVAGGNTSRILGLDPDQVPRGAAVEIERVVDVVEA